MVGLRHRDPRNVAARPRETLHQSFLDRIAGADEHDRDRPGCFLHRLGRLGTTDNNDIEIESHHFRGCVAQSFGLPFPPSPFDDDGATLDITQLPQPLAQDLRASARVPRKKDPDSRHAGRLLCFGGECNHRDPGAGDANKHASIDHDAEE
jgi:hypothetical protein